MGRAYGRGISVPAYLNPSSCRRPDDLTRTWKVSPARRTIRGRARHCRELRRLLLKRREWRYDRG
ncbi:hypothetical protein HMPREF0043_00290 [Actinobaculum sp. oral taxon 183 str. F0552]|nr:hypothetical protein HMPREF0043_00290 [Actinobaculum sp. oral taxon 183 str. F0552]